jgi:seryl-tRNA synthetase
LNGLKIEKQNQLLVSNSSIHEYQNKLEGVRSKVKQGEEEKNHLEDRQKDISKELSQVTLAIKNIYNRCLATMTTTRSSVITSTMNAGSYAATSSSAYSATGNQTLNKNLLVLSERLDQHIAVIHARMIDFIDMLKEFPDSGFTMQSSILTSATSNSSNAGAPPTNASHSALSRLPSNASGAPKEASVASSGYQPQNSKTIP